MRLETPVGAYLDDMTIYSSDGQQHIRHLTAVLKGLTAEYKAHMISANAYF